MKGVNMKGYHKRAMLYCDIVLEAKLWQQPVHVEKVMVETAKLH